MSKLDLKIDLLWLKIQAYFGFHKKVVASDCWMFKLTFTYEIGMQELEIGKYATGNAIKIFKYGSLQSFSPMSLHLS